MTAQPLRHFVYLLFSHQNENRFSVDLNNFGFFPNGTLDVNMHSLRLPEGLNYSVNPVSVCRKSSLKLWAVTVVLGWWTRIIQKRGEEMRSDTYKSKR